MYQRTVSVHSSVILTLTRIDVTYSCILGQCYWTVLLYFAYCSYSKIITVKKNLQFPCSM